MKHPSISRRAFTLVELIVVIVILSILAAIAVVGYLAIVNRSKDTAAMVVAQTISTEARGLAGLDTLTGEVEDLKWSTYMKLVNDEEPLPDGLRIIQILADGTGLDLTTNPADTDTASQVFVIEHNGREACVELGSQYAADAHAPVYGTGSDNTPGQPDYITDPANYLTNCGQY